VTSWSDLAIAGAAAFVAGGVNAIAGGGTLVSFPALVALGVPSLNANITTTVTLCPVLMAVFRLVPLEARKLTVQLPEAFVV
jgi:uncharacterized membrane protein YfcA